MITVYSKQNCVQCNATRRQLVKAGLEFTDISLDTHPEALVMVKARGFTTAPVVEVTIDGHAEAWSGYRPDKIRDVINHLGQNAPSQTTRADIRALVEGKKTDATVRFTPHHLVSRSKDDNQRGGTLRLGE